MDAASFSQGLFPMPRTNSKSLAVVAPLWCTSVAYILALALLCVWLLVPIFDEAFRVPIATMNWLCHGWSRASQGLTESTSFSVSGKYVYLCRWQNNRPQRHWIPAGQTSVEASALLHLPVTSTLKSEASRRSSEAGRKLVTQSLVAVPSAGLYTDAAVDIMPDTRQITARCPRNPETASLHAWPERLCASWPGAEIWLCEYRRFNIWETMHRGALRKLHKRR